MSNYMKHLLMAVALLCGASGFAAEKDSRTLVEDILETDKISGKEIFTQVDVVVSSASKENDMIYERVIGIGSNCLTKAQVNQYFAPDLPNRETKKGHADLFDWMRVCDYYSFARSLSNGLSDFFEIEDFTSHYETYGSPDVVDHKTMLWNSKHNMIWRHLFDSEESQKLWSAVRDGEMTPEKLKEVFPNIRGKLDYLKKKFIAAKDKKTLYIISHYEMDGENPPDLGAITCVRDALV
ncbi:MAG: hypothetical protein WCN27_04040, partial [Alphaproteobacteria bacterium]